MNISDLYTKDDVNGEAIYFVDESCTQAFSGHVEDYDRGFLCMEAEVINGYLKGVCKEYFFLSTKLEGIGTMKANLKNGLWIYFYENGLVQSISLVFNNSFFDSYAYDKFGKLDKITLLTQESSSFLLSERYFDKILKLREAYKLEKINDEILQKGSGFQYEKYFT